MSGSFHFLYGQDDQDEKIGCTVFAWKWQLILVFNFVAKTDEKWKTKDEMKQTYESAWGCLIIWETLWYI